MTQTAADELRLQRCRKACWQAARLRIRKHKRSTVQRGRRVFRPEARYEVFRPGSGVVIADLTSLSALEEWCKKSQGSQRKRHEQQAQDSAPNRKC